MIVFFFGLIFLWQFFRSVADPNPSAKDSGVFRGRGFEDKLLMKFKHLKNKSSRGDYFDFLLLFQLLCWLHPSVIHPLYPASKPNQIVNFNVKCSQ